MSETEFDSYLSLLSKFLRLRSRQRADLADELRDHLEARLEELTAAGKTREQAKAIALEEFGDAALFASEFSHLASRRTRRFVMRCTAASAAVVAAVLFVSLAFAPSGPNGLGPKEVTAQPPEVVTSGKPSVNGDTANVEQQAVAALDAKLAQPIQANYNSVSLKEFVQSVAESIEADVLIDETALSDAGIDLSESNVNIALTRTPVSARTVLGFILEPRDLALVNRSGVLYITSGEMADELLVTRVYNVRDLLENAKSYSAVVPAQMGGGMSGGGFFSVADGPGLATLIGSLHVNQGGGMMGGEMGGGMDGSPQPPRVSTGPADDLIKTVQQTTSGPWFDKDGAGGTITTFNGLLVVRQTEGLHGEVEKLLDALREAGKQSPGGALTVPGMAPVWPEPTPGVPRLEPAGGLPNT